MTALDIPAMLSPRALAEVRAHPDFDQVVDRLAAASLAVLARADETGRWMFRDLGRSALYVAAVILDTTDSGLTASDLVIAARAQGAASRGRVMAFLRYAESMGEITVPPGGGAWTRRRLQLAPAFVERLRKGNLLYAAAAAGLFPELAPLSEKLSSDSYFRRYLLCMGIASQAIPGAATAPGPGQTLFLNRDRGMSMVFRWMISQPRPRSRLLEAAALSRSRLSAEFGVSRIHINRLLNDALAMGLIACPSPDRILFSQTLSDDIEQVLLVTLQITRAAFLFAEASTP